MDLAPYRSQFDISILGPETDEILSAQNTFIKLGHPVWRIPNEDGFLGHFKENPTQLVVLHLLSLTKSIEDFLAELHEIAPSCFVIAVGLPTQSQGVLEYFPYGVVGFAEIGGGLSQRLLWTADLVLERVVAATQVKMLQKDLEDQRIKSTESRILGEIKLQAEDSKLDQERVEDWSNLLTNYEGAKSKEDLLNIFIASLQAFLDKGVRVLYYRYMPAVQGLAVTHALAIDSSQFKNLAVELNIEEQKKPKNHLLNPAGFGSLKDRIDGQLSGLQFRVKPLMAREEVEGIFVFLAEDINSINSIDLNNRFALFKTAFERFVYLKRVVELEINDTITQLLSGEQFNEKLDEEIARARRLLQPVSIVKISIDQLQKLESEFGDAIRDNVIKQIASLLKKTSRVNDILSRTALNEFTLILPHSPRDGAMIKAERLRRIMESTHFPSLPFKITFSLGVNEFPSYAGNASALTKGALMALTTVIQRGGNKIGTAKAPAGYKPEYQYILPEVNRETQK